MSWLAGALFVLAVGTPQAGPALAVDELIRVRELYALASYEEALARLDAAGARVSPERAAQYRALCLIGLSRIVDAERTIERLVMEHPAYAMPEDEVSPRLYTMFRDTRQRLLPAAARERYTEAKTAFDRQQFTTAARGFRDVQALLADPTFLVAVDGLRDLKVLSEGFLGLAEGEMRRAEQAAAQPAPASAPPAVEAPRAATVPVASAPVAAVTAAPTPAAPPEMVVYADGDALVRPPADVNRRLPAWNPPPALAVMEFRGVLEIEIDEKGMVAAARLIDSVHPTYDTSLLDATRSWRFRPATKDDVPVRYRRTIDIVLNRR